MCAAWSVARLQLHDRRLDAALVDRQHRDRHREPEPPRTGAPRVDVQHAVAPLDAWLVGMARDDRAEAAGDWIDVEGTEVVQNVQGRAADSGHVGLGQRVRPRATIDVAANNNEWSQPAERWKDLGIADVAGMDDEIDAAEGGDGFRPEPSVRIGDDTDAEWHRFEAVLSVWNTRLRVVRRRIPPRDLIGVPPGGVLR
jgi:hypothetical protein